ncbi:hypothetical protein DQ04_24021000, partial [Trypanosoma grayi]|uniref:hypothetical protein n=1 Tax=Trypanosoma grayi TaxID=71804 RepID=UPI0004F4B2A0
RLRSMVEAKAGVESSLEAVTAERDGLKEELSATKDELTGRLRSMVEAKAGVESNLRVLEERLSEALRCSEEEKCGKISVWQNRLSSLEEEKKKLLDYLSSE